MSLCILGAYFYGEGQQGRRIGRKGKGRCVSAHLSTTHQSVLHDRHKLLVTQFTVTVDIEELEHNVDDVTVERLTGTSLDGTTKITFTHRHT